MNSRSCFRRPHPEYGWDNNAYAWIWSLHFTEFLKAHAEQRYEVPIVESNQPVDNIENMPFLLLFHGWRDR